MKSIVSLFTREWIEILLTTNIFYVILSPSLRGSGLKFMVLLVLNCLEVSLFTREWIEINTDAFLQVCEERLPLYEGVD